MILKSSIPSPQRVCADCGTEFSGGEVYHSVLSEDDGKWHRNTFCAQCYGNYKRGADFISHWRSVFTEKPKKKRLPKKLVVELLTRLVNDEKWFGVAGLMAWHLVRGKYLRYTGKKGPEDRTVLLFAVVAHSEVIEIPERPATEEDIESFRSLLDEVEEGE